MLVWLNESEFVSEGADMMLDAILERHSVRKYLDREIEKEKVELLLEKTEELNKKSGLSIQLAVNEPQAFGGLLGSYGMLSGVKNYFALVGKDTDRLSELCGYYGELLVLEAQKMGLNTCWVAGTYQKNKTVCEIASDERLVCVIALGYGENSGKPHKGKSIEKLYKCDGEAPEWFIKGVESASLAPTALNQQRFVFEYSDGKAYAKSLGGFYSDIDLGIVKCHFELASGHKAD